MNMASQAQTQANTTLSGEQVRMYLNSAQNVKIAWWIIAIGILALIVGLVFVLSWLWIIGPIIAVIGGGYWYYVNQQTPSDQDFDHHMNMLRNALYYQALRALNIHHVAHLDPLIIQSYVMPGMLPVATYSRENIAVKRCSDHLRSNLSKYTFIFANANFIGIYDGYVDAFDGSTYDGEWHTQYRLAHILSIDSIQNTTILTITLRNESYQYQQEAMTLELTNGRPISLTVFASPVNHDLPTFFATSRADAYQVYNMITHWWQQ